MAVQGVDCTIDLETSNDGVGFGLGFASTIDAAASVEQLEKVISIGADSPLPYFG